MAVSSKLARDDARSALGHRALSGPRNAFRFEAGGGPTSARLEELVRGRAWDLDLSTVAERLLLGSPLDEGATLYAGVRASYLRHDELPALDARLPSGPGEAAQALRQAFEKAVAHALQGVRRAAVLTGGGVDSAALLGLAQRWARKSGATVFATTMDFGGEGDDRPYLAALERHLGCEVVRSRPEDAAKRFELLVDGVDAAPLTWPSAPMEVEALARARAHGAEVVLAGIGADELFDGEPTALARLARRRPLTAWASARRMRGFGRPRSPGWSWIVRPNVSAAMPSFVRRLRRRPLPSELPSWAGPALVAAEERRTRREPRSSTTWRARHHEHLAWLRHQEDLAAGIETRLVFLEPSLQALIATYPREWLVHRSIRRGLFREAVRDLLPAAVVDRTDKAHFEDGLHAWLVAAGGFDRLRPLASGERLAALGLVEPRPFREAFAAFEKSPTDGHHWGTIWPALSVEAFLRGRDGSRTALP